MAVQGPGPNPGDIDMLRFDRPLVIVGGGEVDADLLRQLADAGHAVVGADGGADVCAAAGVMPDAVVGDMDSVSDPKAWRSRTRVLEITEQETTDFEKCLYATQAPVTLALGMTGGRLDHTLGALNAVAMTAPKRRLILLDSVDMAVALTGGARFAVAPGTRVSVHPLHPVRFRRSAGLAFALNGLTLAPGGRTGTSNVADGDTVTIETDPTTNGVWLLIVDRRHLSDIVATWPGTAQSST